VSILRRLHECGRRYPDIDSSISMIASITAKKSEVLGDTAHLFTSENHLY
jgi:hypothetical protein